MNICVLEVLNLSAERPARDHVVTLKVTHTHTHTSLEACQNTPSHYVLFPSNSER